jgi:integrase
MARSRDFEGEIKKVQAGLKAAGVEERKSLADPETPGLQIRITARSAVWVFRYRSGGVQRRLKLGTWTADGGMTIAKARKRAGTERLKVEAGTDPAIEKRELALKAARAQKDSTETLVEEYLERHAKKFKRSWRADSLILHNEVLKHWRGRAVSSITRRDCRELVQRIADRPAPTYAQRVQAILSRVFRFAVMADIIDSNPARDLPRFANPPVQEEPYDAEALRQFWQNTDRLAVPLRQAYRLLALTGCRFGEVRDMRWADVEGEWWTLTGDQTKNARDFRVYLVKTATTALAEIIRVEGDVHVFERHRAHRLWVAANKVVFAGLPARDKPVHCLRRTFATGLAQLGIAPHVIEKALNHVTGGNPATRRYQRYQFDAETQAAWQAWERKLLGIVTEQERTDNVAAFVKMPAGRAGRRSTRG